MTVAYDAFAAVAAEFRVANGDANPKTWTHTPSGTPAGVVVFVYSDTGGSSPSADGGENAVTGVTYGGVSMTKVRFAQCSSAERGFVWMYELLSGVPAGAQTVGVTTAANPLTGDNGDWYPWFWGWSVSMTSAGAGVQRVDDDEVGSASTVTNPSITLNNATSAALGVIGGFSGTSILANITPAAGTTEIAERQFVSAVRAAVVGYAAATTGDVAIGYTIADDDAAFVAASYADLASIPLLVGGGFF